MNAITPLATLFDPTVVRVCEALNEIGIETRFVESFTDNAKTFLESIRIVNGTLHIAPECPVSNVLHEAVFASKA